MARKALKARIATAVTARKPIVTNTGKMSSSVSVICCVFLRPIDAGVRVVGAPLYVAAIDELTSDRLSAF